MAHAEVYQYDTLVIGIENYGEYIGQPEKADSAFSKDGPRESVSERLESAARRIHGRPPGDPRVPVALGEAGNAGLANAPSASEPMLLAMNGLEQALRRKDAQVMAKHAQEQSKAPGSTTAAPKGKP